MPNNAFGKPVRRIRYIITRNDPLSPKPYSMYLAKSGFCTYSLDRAVRYKTTAEAERELEYFRATYPRFTWNIERE